MTATMRIGMDIGGTKVEAIALDDDGNIAGHTRTVTVPGTDGILNTAEGIVAELARQTGRAPGDFASIGIGIPGQIDRAEGLVRHAYNIGIESLPLAQLLSERVGIPVTVDNDVTAAAIGAAHLMGLDGSVAYLNLGTGLAAGFVIDGHPLRGAQDVAGEIGHLAIDHLGRPCPCGQFGCLETVASGSALKRFWPGAGEHPGPSLLPAIAAGDAEAQAAFDNLVRGAANSVRLIVLTLDPTTIVIGGGLRQIGAPLFDAIARQLDEWSAQSPFLAPLGLSARVQYLDNDSPAAATGAALAAIR
ncbi:putative NBD/HSP70 family sugar kinase [Leucobacter exalbidus]|uniref:NBD/HSP70 family sugar kinase n=1 Tax=Leucobacter exalbidus TaxID=662960 RepID=A0A940PPU9_9MICO|nr:ROK family protein [Leucobacter exalbidus]MBP1326965.1 putative NBD/HSP70 family sugar kinase [Leucobacter exalbidus]